MRSLAFRRLARGEGNERERGSLCALAFRELASVDGGGAWHSACHTVCTYVCAPSVYVWLEDRSVVPSSLLYALPPSLPRCSQESAL